MWWETIPGLITLWAGAVAGLAAAVAGLGYLGRQLWLATKVGKRVTGAVGRLIHIGTTDQWPNGAKSLPEAMSEIYDRQGQTHDLLQTYIVAHRADHGLEPPAGTPQGF